jgi:hypothetical protein
MTDLKRDLFFATTDVAVSEVLHSQFVDEFVRRGFRSLIRNNWSTDFEKARVNGWGTDEMRGLATELFVNTGQVATELFARVEDKTILYVGVGPQGSVNALLGMASPEPKQASDLMKKLLTIYPVAAPPDDTSVIMKFWMLGPAGATQVCRTITVPAWGTIAENYSPPTAQGLSAVMGGFEPAHGGQLLLWHGPPGTGKTFAIRALALHWRKWCEVDCIIDPEAFFGSGSYMMGVLTSQTVRDPTGTPHKLTKDGTLWRLLILEDAGELLTEDARGLTGQGLSRMLNLSDGLIGQGLKVLVLVTTNEPLKKMHPAVARPGRCASEIEFKPFTEEEANTWLKTKGQKNPASAGPQTLAEMFGQVEKFSGAKGQKHAPLGLR